jgi:hypothetical protein
MTVFIELAIFVNGQFSAWQDGPEFTGTNARRDAWEWLKARGYTAADKGDKFLVSVS